MFFINSFFVLELLFLSHALVISAPINDRKQIDRELSNQNFLATYSGYLELSMSLDVDMLPSFLFIKQLDEGTLARNSRILLQNQEDRLEIFVQDETNDISNVLMHIVMPFTIIMGEEQVSITIIFMNEQSTLHIKQTSPLSGEQFIAYYIPVLLEQNQELLISSSPSTVLIRTQLSNDTCPPGYYWQTNEDCIACPAGTYSSMENATTCTSCPPGSYSSNLSSIACSLCPSGTYSEDYGNTECSLCGSGTFSDMGSSNCTACPSGTYAPEGGESSCSLCAPGSFSTGNATDCQDCPLGTFAPSAGAPSCSSCPPGTVSSLVGSTSCQPCSDGTATAGNGTICVYCHHGSNQQHTACLDGNSSEGDNTDLVYGVIAALIAIAVMVVIGVIVYRKISPKPKPNCQANPEGKPLMDMTREDDFDEEATFPVKAQLSPENPMEWMFMKRKSEISRDSSETDAIMEDHYQNEISRLASQMQRNNTNIFEGSILDEFIDPITKQMMSDPVVAADGYIYEKEAIQIWMKYHKKSPVTKRTLDNRVLVPNSRLKEQLMQFRTQHTQSQQIL